MSELKFLSAQALASCIRTRTLSAEEVVEAHLRQIASHNPTLNAIVTLDEEPARWRAPKQGYPSGHKLWAGAGTNWRCLGLQNS